MRKATEFPGPGPDAGIDSEIGVKRATPLVLRNSRFLCGVTMFGGLFAAVMSVCMVLMVISLMFLQGGLSAGKGFTALQWGVSALATACMCPWLWKMGRAMACYRVVMDGRGVTFNLGTKKNPADLLLAWDQIAAIEFNRTGNIQRCCVSGKDGSEARFSSYTFFRPKKVARLIAGRAGLTIQKT